MCLCDNNFFSNYVNNNPYLKGLDIAKGYTIYIDSDNYEGSKKKALKCAIEQLLDGIDIVSAGKLSTDDLFTFLDDVDFIIDNKLVNHDKAMTYVAKYFSNYTTRDRNLAEKRYMEYIISEQKKLVAEEEIKLKSLIERYNSEWVM